MKSGVPNIATLERLLDTMVIPQLRSIGVTSSELVEVRDMIVLKLDEEISITRGREQKRELRDREA